MSEKKFNYIDLFAGAGGLSEGFLMNGNFNPVAHIEVNSDACDTLRTRVAYYYLKESLQLSLYHDYQKGLIGKETLYSKIPQHLLHSILNSEISETSINFLFESVDELIKQRNIKNIDLVVGGPPCQAYSLVGRAVNNKMANDPRNYLYKQYIKFIEYYQPKAFIFENVPGILTAQKGQAFKNILEEFKSIGYTVEYKKLNSEDFGVLQNRSRIIIIGWKSSIPFTYPNFAEYNICKTAKVLDLLCDLTPLQRGEENNKYVAEPSNYLLESGIRNYEDILTHHVCRIHNNNDIAIYKTAIESWNNRKQRIKYTDLPEELKTHRNTTSFLDRYKVVASDLRTSQTMIAHIAKDGHYFIHPDISQCRSISVREAARIQSFPDNYYFEGSRTANFTQIGNAVPPLMAKGLAHQLQAMLEGRKEV